MIIRYGFQIFSTLKVYITAKNSLNAELGQHVANVTNIDVSAGGVCSLCVLLSYLNSSPPVPSLLYPGSLQDLSPNCLGEFKFTWFPSRQVTINSYQMVFLHNQLRVLHLGMPNNFLANVDDPVRRSSS